MIVGGGFGGLYAARSLGHDPEVAVTLVDRRNFHLFQPMLYQVATGALSPGEIAQPLRSVLRKQRNTTVILGEAVDLDVEGRRVILSDGGPIEYDSLIVATGARHTYFGHDEWEAVAPGPQDPRGRAGDPASASSSRSRPRNGKPIRTAGASG